MTQPNPAPQGPPAGPATPPAPPPADPAAPPAPPWGDDDNFDPARAWALIQNKQADLDKAKAKVAELTPFQQKAQELEDAQKSELQRSQEATAAANKIAEEKTAEALRLRVALKHGISDDDTALFLTASDEATLTKVAEALAARNAPPATPGSTTPVTALRPTSMPNAPAPTVDDQIAAAKAAKNFGLVIALENSKLANIKK